WTADPKREKVGRDLGYTAFHRMAESLGCHGEYVEQPAEIRPALERALAADAPALVNVLTDWRARATTAQFSVSTTGHDERRRRRPDRGGDRRERTVAAPAGSAGPGASRHSPARGRVDGARHVVPRRRALERRPAHPSIDRSRGD